MASLSHQSPLVWIPIKQTDDVDIASAVRSLISSSYGEDPKNYSQALVALARARSDATSAGHAGNDTTARDLLFKWFHILEMLEVRFPELRVPFTWKDAFTGKSISQFSLAYEKASVIFNIAATLSAVAASTSRLGSSSASADVASPRAANSSLPPTSPMEAPASSAADGDGTKRAYTALRQASGFFNYINQNFLHAPSTDMSRELLKFIVNLLLTQANEVFLEKTLGGKSSPGLIAKLAHGVAKGYADLAGRAKEWNTQEIIDRTWTMLLNAKAKHYLSVTQYYKAQADIAASNHGHALVRFTVAESLSKEAVKFANQFSANFASSGPSASASTTFGYTTPASGAFNFPSDAGTSMAGLASAHLAIVSQRRSEAVKDNDLIYHDILPSESTLPAVDETSPAQAISIQEVYSSPEVQRVVGPDLFAKLVPLGVHERASMYSEEKAKLARSEAERVDSAEGERVAALHGMGLPASLERFKAAIRAGGHSGAGVDALADPGPEVMAWSEEEAKGGPARGADGLSAGAAGINETLRRIGGLRSTAQADLQTASESLDEESRLCEKARVKYGHKFGQDPSGGQPRVKDLRSEIKTNREALRQAQDNDGRIEAKWHEIQRDIDLLARGRSALEQAFAEALASSGDASSGAGAGGSGGASLLDLSESDEQESAVSVAELETKVAAIDSALTKLGKVKKERDSLLTELREKLQTDDIGHLLILSHRGGSRSASGNTDTSSSSSGRGEDPAQAAQEAALFRQELEKFRPWQTRLGQALVAQTHLLSEITRLWSEINTSPEGQQISSMWESKARARHQVVERLRRARDSNAEVRAALSKGVNFYEEAGDIARGLKMSAKQWSEERARERDGMERQAEWDSKLDTSSSADVASGLTHGMSNLGFGGASSTPTRDAMVPQRQSSYGYTSAAATATASPSPSPSITSPRTSAGQQQYGAPPPLPPQQRSTSGGSYAGAYGLPAPPPTPPTTSSSYSSYTGSSTPSTPAPASSLPPPPGQYQPRSSQYQPQQNSSSYSNGPMSPAPPPTGSSHQYRLPPQQPQHQQQYGQPPSSYNSAAPPPPPPAAASTPGYPSGGYQSPYGGYNNNSSAAPTTQQQQQQYQHAPPPPPPQQQQYYQQGGGPPPPPQPLPYQQHHSQPPPVGSYYAPHHQQQQHQQQPPPLPPPPAPYNNTQWRGY